MILELVAVVSLAQTPPPVTIQRPRLHPAQPATQRELSANEDTGETFSYGMAGMWQIRIDRTMNAACFAVSYFTDGTFMRLSADPLLNQITMAIGNWRWRSLTPNQEYEITMRMGDGEPWYVGATAIRFQRENALAFSIEDGEFIDEFTQDHIFTMTWNDRRIANLRLNDTGETARQLAQCLDDVEAIVADPFAE